MYHCIMKNIISYTKIINIFNRDKFLKKFDQQRNSIRLKKCVDQKINDDPLWKTKSLKSYEVWI